MVRFKRLGKSFIYASRGLAKVFREEQNLSVQLLIGLLVIILAWLFHISPSEWGIILLTIALVMVTEVINSAIEKISDVLKPRLDNYVKEIKDIMSAAVMLASLFAILVGLFILGPYAWSLFLCYN